MVRAVAGFAEEVAGGVERNEEGAPQRARGVVLFCVGGRDAGVAGGGMGSCAGVR